MNDVEQRLQQVFGATSISELSKTYDNWAVSYDEDMLQTGYAHPAIICGLISRYVTDVSAPVLDAGVGTGNVGQLLHTLGFSKLHGMDMSEGMLAIARARQIYQGLHCGVLGEALDFNSSSFAAILSTGTFTTGHAPASAFTELARILRPGGYLAFTVGEAVWQEGSFGAALAKLEAAGQLLPIWQSAPYRPMPHSKTEGHFKAIALVYQRA